MVMSHYILQEQAQEIKSAYAAVFANRKKLPQDLSQGSLSAGLKSLFPLVKVFSNGCVPFFSFRRKAPAGSLKTPAACTLLKEAPEPPR